MTEPPVVGTVVIGAGPAGCACAIALAEAGRDVLLLERQPEAVESVCGEFLGPDAVAALARLGLSPASLGAAPVGRMRWGIGRHEVAAALPFAAWALPRRTLDAALRARAMASGAQLRAGAAVQGARPERHGWRIDLRQGAVQADRVVLATGKHALRGHPRHGAGAGWVGLKLHLAGVAPGPEVSVLLFDGGYAGLQPLPGGGANLCAALRGPLAATDAAGLIARVAAGSALAGRLLARAEPRWPRPLAVAGVPYGFRHGAAAGDPPGLYRVGDQAAVVPSFTGEGVAMALHSGLAAAAAILAGQDAAAFHAGWRARTAGPMRWAGAASWWLRHAPGPLLQAAGGLAGLVARRTRLADSGYA